MATQENKEEQLTQEPEETIKNESLKEFLGEEAPVEEVSKDETVEKETVEEIVPTKEVEEEPEPTPEETVEDAAQKTREEVKEEVKQDVLKSLGMTEEQKVEAEEQGFKFPWEKDGRAKPDTWLEQAEGVQEYLDFKKTKLEEEQAKTQAEQEEVNKKRLEEANATWDEQLDYLREEGFIPAIDPKVADKLKNNKLLTAEDKKDPGLVAQANIFDTMYRLSLDLGKKDKKPITDIIHIYNRFYKPQKPAGTQAPVSGSRPSLNTGSDDLTYEQLHNMELEDLVSI